MFQDPINRRGSSDLTGAGVGGGKLRGQGHAEVWGHRNGGFPGESPIQQNNDIYIYT